MSNYGTTIGATYPELPDELSGGHWDQLRTLLAERARVQREASAASKEQAAMPVTLGRARTVDQAAAAAAYRAGKPDPGPVELRKAEAADADVQRRRKSARQAIVAIEREVGALIVANGPQLSAALAERIAAEQAEAVGLAEAFTANVHRQAALQDMAAWVAHPDAKRRPGRTAAVLAAMDAAMADVRTIEPPTIRERQSQQRPPAIRLPRSGDWQAARDAGTVAVGKVAVKRR